METEWKNWLKREALSRSEVTTEDPSRTEDGMGLLLDRNLM